MNLNNNKLRNILAVVVALTLVILPNLVAVADSTEGVQGTPTPTFTSESVDATPSETPAQETSASPTNTSTSEDTETTPSASPSSEADTNEPTATPSVSPSETPAEAVPEASPSESPPVGIPEAAPSETPPIDTPEASPSETPPVEFPESVPSETPPTDTPEATPSETPPTDTPETTPSETPPADTPEAAEPSANFEAARVRTSTVQFSNNPNQGNAHDGYGLGLSHYTYEVKVNGTYQAPVRVSPSGPSDSKTITFPIGAVIRIKAYPKSGYTFKQWWRDTDNHGSSNPFVYTVPGNAFNVQALFLGPQPTVTPAPTSTPPPIISGTLTIYKEDSRGHSLSGASFTLVKDGTSTPISPTSVNGGTFRWVNLPEGDYTLTETSAPSGYQIDGSGVYSVHIGPQSSNVSELEKKPHPSSPPNWDVSKHIENEKISVGSIKVYKKNQDGEKISGATFTLTPAGGGAVITLDETSTGVHKASGLTPGNYTLTETVVPSGYTGSTSQQVTIQGDREKRLTVVNTKPLLGSIKVYKKDQDGERIYGATFTLTPAGGGDAITLTETSRGVHKASGLTPGDYTLTETVVPSGYTGSTSQQVTIQGDREKRLTVVNNKILLGSIKVTKKDFYTNEKLAGATFTLTPVGGGAAITLTETSTGVHKASELAPGNYTLTETVVPSGYTGAASRQVTISGDEEMKVVVKNVPILYGTLTVKKVDADGGGPLTGATFTLVKAGTSTQIAPTSISGNTFVWSNLLEGNYTLTETSAPSGYEIQGSGVYQITIGPSNSGPSAPETVHQTPPNLNVTKTIENDKSLGSLKVLKKDSVSGKLIDGATFKLVKDSAPSTAIAGNDNGSGTFTWTNLVPGEYTLTETSAPNGYYASSSSQSVTISAGAEKELTVLNDPYGSLKVLKKDSVSGELLDGATFKLVKDSAPSTVIAGNDDGNGTFTWTDLLPGDYTLTEEDVPTGYYVASSSQSVTLTQGEDKELTVTNDPYGSLTVLKKDSVSGELLDGATFKLVKDSAPSTEIAGNDDGNGTFTWTDLLPGDYTLTEEGVPTGYYDANYSLGINLTQGEDRELTVNNEKFVSITVLKRSAVTELPLADAVFSIEAVSSNDNVRVQNVASTNVIGGVLGTVTTGSDGTATFAFPAFQLRAGVRYLIKEVTPPYGYLNDSTPVYVTVDTPGGTNEEVALFENNPDYGTVVVAKFQAGSNNQVRLGGVRFSLYRDSVSPGNLVGTQYTDANGNIVWNSQFAGNFVLVEEATIAGYSLPANPATAFTLLPGERKVIILQNVGGPTPTPTPPPPVNPPEATPTATSSPTPVPTATPTPINTDEFIIDDVAPAFGPETGEGDFLFILMGILALIGGALLIIRKKLVLKQ